MEVNELATQEGAPAVTPESAPEITDVQTEAGEVQNSEVQQPAETENTDDKGAEPAVPLKQLIEQRKKRQKAEQEAAYWRGQAEARLAQQPEQTQQPAAQAQAQAQQGPPAPPSLDDYETFEQYERAKDDYLIQAAEYRVAQKLLQQRQAAQRQSVIQSFEQRLAKAAEEDPTIVDIRNDPTLPVSQVMAQLLTRSEASPQILKWLNSNRDEAAKIAKMDPIAAAMEFGKIEATIKSTPKPQPKKVSSAPAPITTVQTTTPASIDEDDLPMEEYYKRRTKKLYGR